MSFGGIVVVPCHYVEEVRPNAATAKLLQIQLGFTIRGLMDLGVAETLYATSQVHSQVVLVKRGHEVSLLVLVDADSLLITSHTMVQS